MKISFKKLLLSLTCLVNLQIYALDPAPIDPAVKAHRKAVMSLLSAIDRQNLVLVQNVLASKIMLVESDLKHAAEVAKDIYDNYVRVIAADIEKQVSIAKGDHHFYVITTAEAKKELAKVLELERAALILAPEYYELATVENLAYLEAEEANVILALEAQIIAEEAVCSAAIDNLNLLDDEIRNSLDILTCVDEKHRAKKIENGSSLAFSGVHEFNEKRPIYKGVSEFDLSASIETERLDCYSRIAKAKNYFTMLTPKTLKSGSGSATSDSSCCSPFRSQTASKSPAFTVYDQLLCGHRELDESTPSLSLSRAGADTPVLFIRPRADGSPE